VHAGLQAINQPINPSINQYDPSIENQSNLKEKGKKSRGTLIGSCCCSLWWEKSMNLSLVRFFFTLSQFEKRKREGRRRT
jgi:hypothetical protein